ncbi:hypothetical protein [Helicobacter sp. 23-1045]
MKKIIILCFLLCFSALINALNAELIEEFILKKDESKVINLFVENTHKTLTIRWTLYKDRGLVMHLNYDRNPHQFQLYKESLALNSFKIVLNHTNSTRAQNPHIIIYFVDFDDDKKEAKFRYYLNKYNAQIEIM